VCGREMVHVRLKQLVAHTTSRDSLAVSTGALEALEVIEAHKKNKVTF